MFQLNKIIKLYKLYYVILFKYIYIIYASTKYYNIYAVV